MNQWGAVPRIAGFKGDIVPERRQMRTLLVRPHLEHQASGYKGLPQFKTCPKEGNQMVMDYIKS